MQTQLTQDTWSSYNFPTIINGLVELLNEKEQNVIMGRFGINGEKAALATIGNKLNITRERVRQIQNYCVKKLQRNAQRTKLNKYYEWLEDLFKQHGEIITESKIENLLFTEFKDKSIIPQLKLGLVLCPEFTYQANKINYHPHFRKENVSFDLVENICKIARDVLKRTKEPFTINRIATQIQEIYRKQNDTISKKKILSALKIDKRLRINGEQISLANWRHVNPKTLYDKILFILRRQNQPLHFTEITNLITRNFQDKIVNQHAVHNELIKRSDFVLVGRGKYGLSEWGYKTGTVIDVIKSIITQHGPLEPKEIINHVLKERDVKVITIQININNKEVFRRCQNNLVHIV